MKNDHVHNKRMKCYRWKTKFGYLIWGRRGNKCLHIRVNVCLTVWRDLICTVHTLRSSDTCKLSILCLVFSNGALLRRWRCLPEFIYSIYNVVAFQAVSGKWDAWGGGICAEVLRILELTRLHGEDALAKKIAAQGEGAMFYEKELHLLIKK